MTPEELSFYREIIAISDPSIRLDSVNQDALVRDAQEIALEAVNFWAATLYEAPDCGHRHDADDPNDVSSLLRDRALESIEPVLEQWRDRIIQWIKGRRSLKAAKQKLESDPDSLLKVLPVKRLERQLEEAMILANLSGREQVLDEEDEERLDAVMEGVRLDAKRPAWLSQPFQEAVKYFRNKVAIPAKSYKQLTADVHDWAFMIAQTTRGDILEAAQWLIDRALADGIGFDEFEKSWQRLIGRRGWQPSNPRHVWTIFDTNIRGATGAGRDQQMRDPGLLARRPIWVWRWRDSPQPRDHHKALHNKGIPADHPFWKGIRQPSGHGCRCSKVAVSRDYAKRKNITILTNPPDPWLIADEGFRVPFNAEAPYGSRDRETFLKEKFKQYSPAIRKVLERDLQDA